MGVHFPDGELDDISVPFEDNCPTNQRTELAAIQIALEAVDARFGLERVVVRIYTDSMYSINCLTRWVSGWKDNGWLTQKGTPVANRDYIEPISELLERGDVEFRHVSAHTGGDDRYSRGNHVADRLAVAGAAASPEREETPPRRRAPRSQAATASRGRSPKPEDSEEITVILVPRSAREDRDRDRTSIRRPSDGRSG